jgi:anthranilate phosphoribosyltransferase
VALVLQRLGTERALVVHGAGLDELPLDGSGVAYDVSTTGVRRRRVTAEAAGLRAAPTVALGGGGSAAESAERIEAVVSGAERGPARDVVLLNAAAALLVAGRAATLRDGAARASRAIDDGHAATLLERLRAARQRPAA